MNTSFSGHFKSHIESLIEQKNAIGYPYATSARILKAFDLFCMTHYPEETVLTKEIAMHWAEKKPREHVNYLARRITPIRQLAKHMMGLGIQAYIIPPETPENRSAMCRIFLQIRSCELFLRKRIVVPSACTVQPGISSSRCFFECYIVVGCAIPKPGCSILRMWI